MAEDSVIGAQKVYAYVDELEGEALNYAVHHALGHTVKPLDQNNPRSQWVVVFGPPYDKICVPLQQYATSPALAMDLIQDSRLSVLAPRRNIGQWRVQYHCSGAVNYEAPAYQSEHSDIAVATARCFVKLKKGNQIFVPLTLIQSKQKGNFHG